MFVEGGRGVLNVQPESKRQKLWHIRIIPEEEENSSFSSAKCLL